MAPRLLIRFMAALDDDDVVLLRRAMTGEAGIFEREVAALAGMLHLAVEWHEPEPTDKTPGRAATYTRDMAMLDRADLVLLFFMGTESMDSTSGTAHLQEGALQLDRPVYAYNVSAKVERIGEYDPQHLYDQLVPAP